MGYESSKALSCLGQRLHLLDVRGSGAVVVVAILCTALELDRDGRFGCFILNNSRVAGLVFVGCHAGYSPAPTRRGIGDKPLAWEMNQWSFGLQFKRLTVLSGVNRGSFKWLRRSAGSYIEVEHPGAGSKALGHQTAQIFDKHYNARLAGDVHMPPELSVG